MNAPLLQGTVTFLFTDIEGSTKLWEQHPQAMEAALARHDLLAVEIITRHGGTLVKHRGEGDSLFAVFRRAIDAVTAAAELQCALPAESCRAGVELGIRMALHTGEAALRDEDYFGAAVNRCARLRAAAHGGQILLSLATQQLVRDDLPRGAALRDLGERRLRDLIQPEHVFQLLHPNLPQEFPPLNTLDLRLNNLPAQANLLVGREHEVASARDLLRSEAVRLLTLTGPGGTGKTRLGLQVAADLMDEFRDGVFFVELAPISEPGLVVSTITQTLGIRETGGTPLAEMLKEHLQSRQMLLVLDNFEQLLEAAPLVSHLLAAAPALKVLVTSRAVLHLLAEQEYAVPPLPVPDLKRLPPAETLARYSAVDLFVQRARNARSDFTLNEENAAAVAEICARLDGLPLALELAAARIKLLPPQALLSRLDNRLKLLTGGARDLPARQRTLRDTLAWSHDLLGDGEKALFRRLSVFVGGCTFEAVEAVCNAEGDLDVDVLEGLASLVDKSLLRQEETAGEPRFTMLETMREYGRERLTASGEEEAIRRQHAQFYLALAVKAEPELQRAQQSLWLDRLEREHDNLRAVLAWCKLAASDAETGLRLSAALWPFWWVHGHCREGRRWLETALSQARGSSAPARAKALNGAGVLALGEGDLPAARALLTESLSIWGAGDRRGMGAGLHNLGMVAHYQNDAVEARSCREARLRGAADALLEATGRASQQRDAGALLPPVDEEASTAAWAEGRAMTLDQAVSYALQETADG